MYTVTAQNSALFDDFQLFFPDWWFDLAQTLRHTAGWSLDFVQLLWWAHIFLLLFSVDRFLCIRKTPEPAIVCLRQQSTGGNFGAYNEKQNLEACGSNVIVFTEKQQTSWNRRSIWGSRVFSWYFIQHQLQYVPVGFYVAIQAIWKIFKKIILFYQSLAFIFIFSCSCLFFYLCLFRYWQQTHKSFFWVY